MINNLNILISNSQYKEALLNLNQTPRPFHRFPKPKPAQLEEFLHRNKFTLTQVLDSPIGVFLFKKFARAFTDLSIIVDFLIEFEKVTELEEPDMETSLSLLEIALALPGNYQKHVVNLKEAFKDTYGLTDPFRELLLLSNPELENEQKENEYAQWSRISGSVREQFPQSNRPESVKVLSQIGGPKSPMGRSQITYGGFLHKKQHPSAPAARESVVETEFLPAAGEPNENPEEVKLTDFYDRHHETKVKHSEAKKTVKESSLKVFSKLASILRDKAEELFATFKNNSPEYEEMIHTMWYAEQKLNVSDFILFRDLGKGAFGTVSAAKTKTTGALTAIKCINKKLIKGKRALRTVKVEKAILQILGDSPSNFTIWLKYAFQDPDYFYLAIPLCTGGDMGYHIKKRRFIREDCAKFYIAEILEGIDHLHKLTIVYRDLKPENIIFDVEGHARISDMGLAIKTDGAKIRGRAGTSGYWAPEVISKQPYSYSADYWSLGCVLYEMLTGLCPFSSTVTGMERDRATMTAKIKFPDKVVGQQKNQVPFVMSAKPVILGLLNRDRSARFSATEMRNHEWFKDLNFRELQNRQISAPWKPVEGRIYAADILDLEAQGHEKEFRKLKLGPEDELPDFSYTSKYSHQLDIVDLLETKEKGNLKYDYDSQNHWCDCSCM